MTKIPSAEEVINIFSPKDSKSAVKFGTIPADYVSGLPQVIFDGESSASIKKYAYLGSYTPAANDRVAILKTKYSGLILGKIINE